MTSSFHFYLHARILSSIFELPLADWHSTSIADIADIEEKHKHRTSPAMSDPRLKQLKIKTGTLKRNMKDYTSYKKEETQLNEKLQKMIEDGKDEYDIKKM